MTLGGAKRLSDLIGVSQALNLVLTGQLIPANIANDLGLVARLISTGTGTYNFNNSYTKIHSLFYLQF